MQLARATQELPCFNAHRTDKFGNLRDSRENYQKRPFACLMTGLNVPLVPRFVCCGFGWRRAKKAFSRFSQCQEAQMLGKWANRPPPEHSMLCTFGKNRFALRLELESSQN